MDAKVWQAIIENQLIDMAWDNDKECICTRVCDCQCPELDSGVALVSNGCPIHNWFPEPDEDCPAKIHCFDEPDYIEGSARKQLSLALV